MDKPYIQSTQIKIILIIGCVSFNGIPVVKTFLHDLGLSFCTLTNYADDCNARSIGFGDVSIRTHFNGIWIWLSNAVCRDSNHSFVMQCVYLIWRDNNYCWTCHGLCTIIVELSTRSRKYASIMSQPTANGWRTVKYWWLGYIFPLTTVNKVQSSRDTPRFYTISPFKLRFKITLII